MKIIPVHTNKSERVEHWPQIEAIAKELKEFATNGPFVGPNYKSCYALHHAQVEEKPLNFFCLSEQGAKILEFPHWCIINPEILTKSIPFRPLEGCMSWPFRKEAKKDRYMSIVAKFQYPKRKLLSYELATVEVQLNGLMAHVFQHEYDHGQGKTIHS